MKPQQRRGRPPKFGRRATPVTMTLPEDVLERLKAINPDVGRAVVGLIEQAPRKRRPRQLVEVAQHGGRSVILVTPARALRKLPGVQLMPVAEGKALIALNKPHGIPSFELAVLDTLDRGALAGQDRQLFEQLAEVLKTARLSHELTIAERSIIVFESRSRRIES